MHNICNKSNYFYLFDRENHNTYFIGDKNELIRFLANTCDYNNESKNFHSSILSNLNLGNDYYCTHDGIIYIEIKKHPRKYLFFDGYNRIIDVRMFFDDIIKLIYSEPKRYYRYYSSPYWEGYLVSENLKRINRRKRRQHRKLHKTYAIKGTMPKIKQAKTIDNMFKNDEEYKEYHFTPIEDKIEKYPVYWDDTYRIIQSNWKKQHKVRHQYEIHSKRRDSFRYYRENDYTDDEIDEMLLYEYNCK